MEQDLFSLIEAPTVTAEFDLFSDKNLLYRWIRDHSYTRALLALAERDASFASAVANRAISLFDAPAPEGYRTDHEAAICFYAIVLSRLEHPDARRVVDELDANSDRVYGWLDMLLGCALRDASTTSWGDKKSLPPSIHVLGRGSSSSFSPYPYSMSTPFEQLDESFAAEPIILEVQR